PGPGTGHDRDAAVEAAQTFRHPHAVLYYPSAPGIEIHRPVVVRTAKRDAANDARPRALGADAAAVGIGRGTLGHPGSRARLLEAEQRGEGPPGEGSGVRPNRSVRDAGPVRRPAAQARDDASNRADRPERLPTRDGERRRHAPGPIHQPTILSGCAIRPVSVRRVART